MNNAPLPQPCVPRANGDLFKASARSPLSRGRPFLLMLFILLFAPITARADENHEYAPEHCEFSITFPEAPYEIRKCEDNSQNRCYDLVTYTQVYELSSTVNIEVICNKIPEETRRYYNKDVIASTLNAMSRDNNLTRRETSYREAGQYKQGGLVGAGTANNDQSLYIAQIWVGDTSLLSIEAELIGANNDTADKLFSDILKTVKFKEAEPMERLTPPEKQE